MPRRDGTGPNGQGARDGRGFGNCASSETETNLENQQKFGRRNGHGRKNGGQGFLRGLRNGFGIWKRAGEGQTADD